jgi:hypothetical protein
MLLQEDRERAFLDDMKKISKYLSKRFKVEEDSIRYNNSYSMKYIFRPKEKELKKLEGKGFVDEFERFNNELWKDLKLVSIRGFLTVRGRIEVLIDYKANIEIVETKKPIQV